MKGDDEEYERRKGIKPNLARSRKFRLTNAKDDEPKNGQERAEKQAELRGHQDGIEGPGKHENRNDK